MLPLIQPICDVLGCAPECQFGILAFAFIFLKIAYVSIPRGSPPFDQVTQAVYTLLGIH